MAVPAHVADDCRGGHLPPHFRRGTAAGLQFWLIASGASIPGRRKSGSVRFRRGDLGGLLSALVAERVAVFGVPAMLPFLAVLQFSAWCGA
jgi:hypothetical protein